MSPKVYILEEKEYAIKEEIPPNFLVWFECKEKWDRFEENIF